MEPEGTSMNSGDKRMLEKFIYILQNKLHSFLSEPSS
jgi:hypothetical protein